jgi:hypothetical protein
MTGIKFITSKLLLNTRDFLKNAHIWHDRASSMKNTVLLNVTPCRSCKKRRFVGKYRLHHQGENNQQAMNVSSSYSRFLQEPPGVTF